MRVNYSMDFEYCIRQFLGDKADHIADLACNEKLFRKHLRKCIPVLRKRVDELDTTTRHKERLMDNVEALDETLKMKSDDKEIIIKIFWIVSRLLGFDWVSGKVFNEPFYYQKHDKYLWEKAHAGKNLIDVINEDRKNTISIRRKVYKQLLSEGLLNHEIAQVLNTTEYEIRKLKHDL